MAQINFKEYDKQNPQIWDAFKEFAYQAKHVKGFKHYSANGIFELIRWHTPVKGGGNFKISNNYRPDYARKMMEMYPEFEGFFRVKELKAPRS
jgi:hypothetical protein